jgi:hypothetical protein
MASLGHRLEALRTGNKGAGDDMTDPAIREPDKIRQACTRNALTRVIL